MELKTKTYTLTAEYLNGKTSKFEFDNLNETLAKKAELSRDESVVSIVYNKTATYSRHEEVFDKRATLDTICDAFRVYCVGKNCSFCRYRNAPNCEVAFIIDHYEAKDGGNND